MEIFIPKIIGEAKLYQIDSLDLTAPYQRWEPARYNKLKRRIKKYAYDAKYPIAITKDGKIVIDGRHRWQVCKDLGFKEILAVEYSCLSLNDQIDLFVLFNDWTEKQKPKDLWYAKYLRGDVYAVYLYKLEDDPISFFHQKIALKGKDTKDSKFSIAETLNIINASVLNVAEAYKTDNGPSLERRIAEIEYETVKNGANLFLKWFYDSFGRDKIQNPLPYGAKPIRALIGVFLAIKRNRWFNTNHEYRRTITKMQQFVFTPSMLTANTESITDMIILYLNRGKSVNLLELRK